MIFMYEDDENYDPRDRDGDDDHSTVTDAEATDMFNNGEDVD